MVSLDHHSYTAMLARSSADRDDFALYPEPPQGAFTSSSAPLDMSGIPTDPYTMFPAASSMAAFEHSPSSYADAPSAGGHYGLYAGQPSPGAFDDGELQIPASNVSSASAPSASSSAVGSPQSHHGQLGLHSHNHHNHAGGIPDQWNQHHQHHHMTLTPGIVPSDFYAMAGSEYTSYTAAAGTIDDAFAAFEFPNHNGAKPPGFVDPSLIHPEITGPMPMPGYDVAFQQHIRYPTSPSAASSPQPVMRNASRSPYLHDAYQQPQTQQHPQTQQYSPFQPPMDGRRPSVHSFPSTASYEGNGYSGDETSKEKQRCPHPDCGKTFKDLKAHMLTHQTERPEKCPIQTCEYHVKGFARKYDKNRHTLTHYKGTMVCGFCPGSGSAAEKSFNRADVFKRHLTAVHGVEQTPPNSRKKAPGGAGSSSASSASSKGLAGYPPDATGKCSTCSQTFSNAQDFYEHLDDCVLRIVQQEDPAEANNARLLGALENDKDVVQTMQRNNLPTQTQAHVDGGASEDDDEEMDDDEDEDDEDRASSSPSKRQKTTGGKSRGLTHSRGGVPLRAKAKGARKSKTRKPGSWGFDKELVTLKKRVMCAFDGPRRLAKDDMMLSTEQEVRIKLSDGKSYTTDLDIYTIARAEGFHSATDEEKGPWVSDDPTEAQYRQMQDHAALHHIKHEHDMYDAEVMA